MRKILLIAAVFGISPVVFGQDDNAAFHIQKGLEEKQHGRKQEAVKHFEKAYEFNKADKQVVSELAAGYLDLRRYAQAREKFLQLEQLGDKSDSTYRQLMQLSFNMRQFDDVIKYASLLKKNNPSEKTAYYLAKAFYAKEDLGNAIKYFDFAAKEDPTNADIPYTVARAYADMQNYKAAIPYFQKAVSVKQDPRWIYEMALIYYAIPDDKNALKYMLEAAEKGLPKDNEYSQNLSIAYLNAGRFDEGINILKEALQRRPSDINILNMMAEAHYDAKKYGEAIKYYDQILSINKSNAEALYMIGLCYQKSGEKEKGMALCDKAIEMDPSLKSLKQEKKIPGF